MNLFSIHSSRCLVIETDGFSVRAAVLRRRGRDLSAERWAESQTVDRDAAVAEVLDELGPSLPRQAIVITTDVVAALVELPVSPGQRRPWSQMQQMLRWEIEPHLAQQAVARPLAEILACRGCLTDQQVEQVQQELQLRQQTPTGRSRTGSVSGDAFGDLAIELGLVSREQLSECQQLQQEQQVAEDDEVVCGWAPQTNDGATAGPYRWMACGTTRSRRREWNERLTARDIRLRGLYPLMPSSAGAAETTAAPAGVMLDVYRGWIGVTEVRGSTIESLQLQPLASGMPSVETCRELIGDRAAGTVWLSGSHPEMRELAEQLQRTSGMSVEVLELPVPTGTDGAPPPVSAAMIGAARHCLGLSARPLAVAAEDPGPRLSRRPATWAAAAALLVAAAIGAAEWSLAARRSFAQRQYDAAREALDKVELAIEAVEQRAARAEQLKTELAGLRENGADLAAQDRFWRQDVPARAARVAETFDAIAGSVSDSVALDGVEEKPDGQIEIEIWALRDVPAHEFARNLSVQLSGDYALSVEQGGQRAGRLKLAGYALTLQLARESSEQPDAPEMPFAMRAPLAQQEQGRLQK